MFPLPKGAYVEIQMNAHGNLLCCVVCSTRFYLTRDLNNLNLGNSVCRCWFFTERLNLKLKLLKK